MSKKGWTMPVQSASYAGVGFNVFSVDDKLDRAVVRHDYPFVHGADIESLGLNPHSVHISAVFYGEGYYADFKAFLKVLQSNKPAVLVHPILGRMPNMQCISSSFSHEAEYVDYVTLDLQFEEATEAQPIFVFENALLTKIDGALNAIDSYISMGLDYYHKAMEGVATALSLKSKVLSYWTAISSTYTSVRDLFDLDQKKYSVPSNTAQSALNHQAKQAATSMAEMIETGLSALVPSLDDEFVDTGINNANSYFNDVSEQIARVRKIPTDLVVGVETAPTAAEVAARLASNSKPIVKNHASHIGKEDIKLIDCFLATVCAGVAAKIAAQLIEQHADKLLPKDIESICTKVRLNFLDVLNLSRALAAEMDDDHSLYTQNQVLAESVRDVAHQLTQLAIAAINQKPPLIIRDAPITGNIVQIAHTIYGDYTRATEILHLNPSIRHPNFIAKGTELNTYAV